IDQNGLSRCVQGQVVYEPRLRELDFPFPRRLAGAGLGALVISPLIVEKEVVGVLAVSRRQPDSFSSTDCEFQRQLSEHVALASRHAQLYENLLKAYDDLRLTQASVVQQERLRVLGQMASGIAHDINNAVSPLALHTASLKESETGLSSRMQAYLATVERVTNDVAATMARLREFYREREPLTAMRPFNLNAVVRQTVDLTRARWANMAQQRGATISVRQQLDPQLAPLLGHDNELREMLTNLIFNAVDALPQGGEILLSTSNVAATPPAEPRIRLEVTDNGAGMDEQTVQRCMEPFFTTKGERGTGLGLAMVFGTAKRHGAEIAIESAPGKGTTMRLEFPQAALQEVPAPAPRARLAPEPMRLLIIDDDPFVLDSMKVVLELDEHTVTQVDSGHKGVEIFRAARDRGEMFSAVITDLGMPHMNGNQVARAIKAISPSTPVILLTGWGQRLRMDDDATSDLDAYVDVVLSKPPQLDELREALARLA
ncbi:MAG TPA: ATP-binding protein, partial [Rhizomicrobium sp.]|nr:ATP-binding protein [Rhizomicrobium sp.]